MKYAPRKVFILQDGEYIELTNEEYERRKDCDPSYADRYFIPVQGFLLEVSRKAYEDFYRAKERQAYLRKLDLKYGLLSIDAFDTEDDNGTDYISDETEDVAETVAHLLLLDRLRRIVDELPEDEKKLITEHFYEGIPQTELSERYGVNQSNISRRIARILGKVKKLLEI